MRNYVKKTNRQSWEEDAMLQAVLSVENGDLDTRKIHRPIMYLSPPQSE